MTQSICVINHTMYSTTWQLIITYMSIQNVTKQNYHVMLNISKVIYTEPLTCYTFFIIFQIGTTFLSKEQFQWLFGQLLVKHAAQLQPKHCLRNEHGQKTTTTYDSVINTQTNYMVLNKALTYLFIFFQIFLFLGFWMCTYGVAFFVSMAFEAPMIGLERLLLKKQSS